MNKNKKIPLRKCVGCQEMHSKKEMIRVIRTAYQEFMLDATGRKNGRALSLPQPGMSGESQEVQGPGALFRAGDPAGGV